MHVDDTSDWRDAKRRILENCERVVIKVGSAVLTSDRGLDLRVVNRLADQIAVLHDKGMEVVIVTSGAVAAGRRAIMHCKGCRDEGSLPARQAVSAIGQSRLMHEYDEAFFRYGKTTAQILLTRADFEDRARFLNARNTLRTLLDWRVIPIINENDTVAVAELKFGDNDTLASMVLSLVEADLFVNLTSAKGVFSENPEKNPAAKPLPVIEHIADLDIEAMCSGKTAVGSGGMYSKLLAARRAAQLAVPTLIVSGLTPFALEKAFEDDESGTLVLPAEHAVSRRKFWLAYHTRPAGQVWIDQGAATALRDRGKSLLAAGVTRVENDFNEGSLVRILDFQGQTIGVGLSNYSGKDLQTIMGLKTDDIARVLGPGLYAEVIHRDNMLLDPAL
ncbi:Glutamate 5-kinase [Desulfovibrio sp. X2]|uniref:glutamate 5-kinase n=1 Tax=Desulfovibrio sp. X2 TaxID=941449 RepID=UPI000358AA38|nr:glutamate 5-kinase [Desulfovibrio sp. X2]EPR41751.1 Glutamate 5-kinase [Desulfovibrio sp. X2]